MEVNEQYKKYLQSEIWKYKRLSVLNRDKYTCQECGSQERLEVHHKTYKNIYNEPNEDLLTLCRECHTMEHNKHWIKYLNKNDFYRSFVYQHLETEYYLVAEYDDRKMRVVKLANEMVKDGVKYFALHDYKGVILYSENIHDYMTKKYPAGYIELSDGDNVSMDTWWDFEAIKLIGDRSKRNDSKFFNLG